jgi:hypothetical protein
VAVILLADDLILERRKSLAPFLCDVPIPSVLARQWREKSLFISLLIKGDPERGYGF